ncbi:hypothetical protein [Salinactinospora qingdaonensis]|uniref:hypothetical protein n=1 Tax=Salinactinospora qingdaonensis TaxID=702744 RepID=UPI0031E92C63
MAVIAAGIALTGCGTPAEPMDQESYNLVEEYVAEQTSAVEEALVDAEAIDEVERINETYLTAEEWPEREEISSWTVNLRTDDGNLREIDGGELSEAVYGLAEASRELVDTLSGEGSEMTDVMTAHESAESAVAQAREVLYGA